MLTEQERKTAKEVAKLLDNTGWKLTPEGYEYWRPIYRKLIELSETPKLERWANVYHDEVMYHDSEESAFEANCDALRVAVHLKEV